MALGVTGLAVMLKQEAARANENQRKPKCTPSCTVNGHPPRNKYVASRRLPHVDRWLHQGGDPVRNKLLVEAELAK